MITREELKSALFYDPETGIFTWRARRGVKAGQRAGTVNQRGYVIICIGGALYGAHRLAWLYMRGEFPAHLIDHINGDPIDNRLVNLRPATLSENQHNRGISKTNTSGVKGVHWRERNRVWEARICAKGKRRHLGNFKTLEAAAAAYATAAKELHGEFARTCDGNR